MDIFSAKLYIQRDTLQIARENNQDSELQTSDSSEEERLDETLGLYRFSNEAPFSPYDNEIFASYFSLELNLNSFLCFLYLNLATYYQTMLENQGVEKWNGSQKCEKVAVSSVTLILDKS